jgi:hypothetical protein
MHRTDPSHPQVIKGWIRATGGGRRRAQQHSRRRPRWIQRSRLGKPIRRFVRILRRPRVLPQKDGGEITQFGRCFWSSEDGCEVGDAVRGATFASRCGKSQSSLGERGIELCRLRKCAFRFGGALRLPSCAARAIACELRFVRVEEDVAARAVRRAVEQNPSREFERGAVLLFVPVLERFAPREQLRITRARPFLGERYQ